ncbi:MAG TPA: DUF6263 family protein [Candidatus Acidoferrales bacterium]|jgi:hypothetical protein|nr:DUF6263 family protein [Candidatus Acidoferrales bacterium]
MTKIIQKGRVVFAGNPGRPHPQKYFTVAILLALLVSLSAPLAQGQDDEYLTIYGIMNQADVLATGGKTSQAHAKYIEAQRALEAFQRANPTWSPEIVTYRSKDLAEKIAATSGKAVAAENNASTPVQPAAKTAAKSPVKLLAAGSEPRTVLRLHPAVGDRQTMSMTMKMGMEMTTGGSAMPAMDIPAMLMTMDVAVKDISATGDITYEMVFTDATVASDASVAPAMAAAMKSSLAGMRGMTGTGKISTQGIVSGVEMKLPAGADPQLSQTMGQMKDSFSSSATALPEEAVGPGAKWECQTRVKSQGMTIDQTINYELVSLDGDRLILRSTILQNAANQKIESPAMPGMKMDLNKMTGAGTGSTTLDLGKIMPSAGSMDEKTEINMGMNIGQQKQAMDMKMNIKITLESK